MKNCILATNSLATPWTPSLQPHFLKMKQCWGTSFPLLSNIGKWSGIASVEYSYDPTEVSLPFSETKKQSKLDFVLPIQPPAPLERTPLRNRSLKFKSSITFKNLLKAFTLTPLLCSLGSLGTLESPPIHQGSFQNPWATPSSPKYSLYSFLKLNHKVL